MSFIYQNLNWNSRPDLIQLLFFDVYRKNPAFYRNVFPWYSFSHSFVPDWKNQKIKYLVIN